MSVARADSPKNPAPAGRVSVVHHDGVWWFQDGAGRRFLSTGVSCVRADSDSVMGTQEVPFLKAIKKTYGSVEAWRPIVARQLQEMGFNTIGPWSDDAIATAAPDAPMYRTPVLDLGHTYERSDNPAGNWQRGHFPDIFEPAFEQHVMDRVKALCASAAEDPTVLGWFTDNELRWGPDWRTAEPLLTTFLARPPESAGRKAATAFLKSRHATVEALNQSWSTAFASWDEVRGPKPKRPPAMPKQNESPTTPADGVFGQDCDAFAGSVAERYFSVTVGAIRVVDPGRLVLGCRFAYWPGDAVLAAAVRHTDVLGVNIYALDPTELLNRYAVSGRPILIGEFSVAAADSGLPNTKGAGPRVATQADRAAALEKYVQLAASCPNVVGYHFFKHCDPPAAGRFDGENTNYGLVRMDTTPYVEVSDAFR
ncbi:MAG TPA: beta-galactosidase, partial [Tepidisphaeraceae bacterium]